MASTSLAPSILVSHNSSAPQFQVSGIRLMFGYKGFGCRRGFQVRSKSTIQEKELRRCSPSLERSSLPKQAALRSNEWKIVPDIWRSYVEKYGDKVAVVDPYHDPPSTLTYKQVLKRLYLEKFGVLKKCNGNVEEKEDKIEDLNLNAVESYMVFLM